MTARNFMLKCSEHGSVPWQNHCVCEKCGFVFDAGAPDAPMICNCGAQLAPDPTKYAGGAFAARPICPTCYRDRAAQQARASS